MPADVAEILLDLNGQLARRRQDDGTRVTDLALGHRRSRQQAVQNGNQEGRGLAGSGLCLPGDVAPCKGKRQGHGLDWRAADESGFVQTRQQARMQVETFKYGVGKRLMMCHSKGISGGGSAVEPRPCADLIRPQLAQDSRLG